MEFSIVLVILGFMAASWGLLELCGWLMGDSHERN